MFKQSDIEKICKIIEDNFECITAIQEDECTIYHEAYFDIPYIHVDDRLGTYDLDIDTPPHK